MKLKLGKLPAQPGAVKLKLSSYLPKLPKISAHFGYERGYPVSGWGMLGNDHLGDCVFAGAAHEVMLWNKANKRDVPFTDASVISDYSAVTGYSPAVPYSDRGTFTGDMLKYRRKIGVLDAKGNRHKILAYLELDHNNLEQIAAATFLFGVVGLGIKCPASAQEQFAAGKTWDVVGASGVDGGHYIPLVARRNVLKVITWGKLQGMTLKFARKYIDEAVVTLSADFLTAGKAPNGFKKAQLLDDLKEITK